MRRPWPALGRSATRGGGGVLNFRVYGNPSDGNQFYAGGRMHVQTDGDDETKHSPLFAILRTRLKRRHFHGNNGYVSAPACNVRTSPSLTLSTYLPSYISWCLTFHVSTNVRNEYFRKIKICNCFCRQCKITTSWFMIGNTTVPVVDNV